MFQLCDNIMQMTSVFHASVLLLITNFVSSYGSTRGEPSGSADYFDNVMTKFIFDDRADA